MAGDWTKMRDDLGDDPAVFSVAKHLEIDVDTVVGKLLRVWSWAGKHTLNGRIIGANRALVDQVARMTSFAESLEVNGWLSFDEYGCTFPKWNRHNSKSAKRRALEQRRKSASRADTKRTRSGQKQDQRRREEKREEEKRDKEQTPLPPCLDLPEFRSAWSDWTRHRSEIKHPLKPTMASNQLAMLAELGPDRAIAMIRHTITKGWQGLREPENGQQHKPAVIGGLYDPE